MYFRGYSENGLRCISYGTRWLKCLGESVSFEHNGCTVGYGISCVALSYVLQQVIAEGLNSFFIGNYLVLFQQFKQCLLFVVSTLVEWLNLFWFLFINLSCSFEDKELFVVCFEERKESELHLVEEQFLVGVEYSIVQGWFCTYCLGFFELEDLFGIDTLVDLLLHVLVSFNVEMFTMHLV